MIRVEAIGILGDVALHQSAMLRRRSGIPRTRTKCFILLHFGPLRQRGQAPVVQCNIFALTGRGLLPRIWIVAAHNSAAPTFVEALKPW
jgi:hypothetical protein